MTKAVNKQALGRGLSALLKDPENDIQSVEDKNADKVVGNIIELEIEAIEINPFQPRTNFNEESLLELASSIRELSTKFDRGGHAENGVRDACGSPRVKPVCRILFSAFL